VEIFIPITYPKISFHKVLKGSFSAIILSCLVFSKTFIGNSDIEAASLSSGKTILA
jgi:hypothetical protein